MFIGFIYNIYSWRGQFTDFSNIVVPHTYFNETMTAFHGVLGDTGLTPWSWIMWDVKGDIIFFILANIGVTAGSSLIRREVPLTKTLAFFQIGSTRAIFAHGTQIKQFSVSITQRHFKFHSMYKIHQSKNTIEKSQTTPPPQPPPLPPQKRK